MNDLRFAFRQLLKNPGFTAVAVLTLALGIGATTAIVSVVQTAVFDPLPARHPERLVQLGVVFKEREWSAQINPSAVGEVRRQTNLFARVAAYEPDGLTLQGEEFQEVVEGVRVTPEFFDLWNTQPMLGRAFRSDETKPGLDDVLVLSHRFWQREFGGDPDIIGRTVRFSQRPMTVVGVMPPHFSFPRAYYEYWRLFPGPDPASDDLLANTSVIAETQPDIEIARVQAFLEVLAKRQAEQFGQERVIRAFQVRELREMFIKPEVRRILGLLLGAIALVLLIAAANTANLQLARTETRRQELAVRAALGAGRVRVFRQLLTENLVLAVLGGAAGLAVTASGLDLLEKLIPADLPRLKPIALNADVLFIAAGVTLLTGMLFGLAPAWLGWQGNLGRVLKLGAATGTRDRGRGRFSRTLIVGQVALALVLLVGAGLMVRSVVGLLRADPGYDPRYVLHVNAGGLSSGTGGALSAMFARFADAQQRIVTIPGVTAAGYAFKGRVETEVAAEPDASSAARVKMEWIAVEQANPLRVLRVPLKQGRWLNRSDLGKDAPSVLVNETAARQFWPGENAAGKRLWRIQNTSEAYLEWLQSRGFDTAMVGRPYEVVGVVGDTIEYSGVEVVAAHYTEEPQPLIYRPLENVMGVETAEGSLFVRTAVPPAALYQPIGRAFKAAGAGPSMPLIFNLQEVLRAGRANHRTIMLYLSIFAGVGLLLAAIGLYGLLAYSVARRTREIGIRMALGAQMADVMRLVLSQGMALVAVGGIIGITVALATGRVLHAYLFGVSSTDPIAFFGVALLLGGVALFACWLPARRASKVEPMVALRSE